MKGDQSGSDPCGRICLAYMCASQFWDVKRLKRDLSNIIHFVSFFYFLVTVTLVTRDYQQPCCLFFVWFIHASCGVMTFLWRWRQVVKRSDLYFPSPIFTLNRHRPVIWLGKLVYSPIGLFIFFLPFDQVENDERLAVALASGKRVMMKVACFSSFDRFRPIDVTHYKPVKGQVSCSAASFADKLGKISKGQMFGARNFYLFFSRALSDVIRWIYIESAITKQFLLLAHTVDEE